MRPLRITWSFSARTVHGRSFNVDPEQPGNAGSPSLSGIQTASPRQPPSVPDYELLRCIGRGSYGDVWLARNVLGDLRAVKFVYRDRFTDPRPFEREFEGIQRFEPISRSHPSQLHILHVGKNESAGCFYYVMELADDLNAEGRAENGESLPVPPSSLSTPQSYAPCTLRAVLEARGRLPVPECITIGLSLSTALQHLHEQGLVHRDIKPSNVIFVKGEAKLGDIGLVTDAGDTQSIVGTEGYLPPEGPGTPQADLYSLGKVFYEMSTGLDRRRFAELPEDIWQWSDHRSVIEFNEIVLKACAKNAQQRYNNAQEIWKDLELLEHGQSIRRARVRQRWRTWITTAFFFVVLLAGVGLFARAVWPGSMNPSDRLSANPLALKEYQEGSHCVRRDTREGWTKGIELFNKAIELDPEFVMAYNGLYEIYLGLQDAPAMRRYVDKMLHLEPNLAEAHAGLGWLTFLDWRWSEAESHFRRAIELNPRCAIAHMRYGFALTFSGRTDDARHELLNAERLDPTLPKIKKNLGHVYYVERKFTEAIAQYQKAIDLEPTYPYAHNCIGWAYRALGDYAKSMDEMEISDLVYKPDTAEVRRRYTELRGAFASGGTNGYWHKWGEQGQQLQNFYLQAQASAHLNNYSRALDFLEQHYSTNIVESLGWLLMDEAWDPVHDDPRFIALLQKTGLRK